MAKQEQSPRLMYLDQFAWIGLARGRLGRDERHKKVREALLTLVLGGKAILPLSHVHYLETWKRRNERQRRDLATEMGLLSQFYCLAPARKLWPQEIEHSLHRLFGKPATVEEVKFLGLGAAFAHGHPELQTNQDDSSAEDRFLSEWSILASPHESSFERENQKRVVDSQSFAQGETRNSHRLKEWMVNANEKRRRFRIHTLSLFEQDLVTALIANDIRPEDFEALGTEGLEQLVAETPTLWILTELRRLRFSNPAQGFRPNDLNDLRALSVALRYCDVVVTDKAWVHAATRTDVEQRFGTMVTSDLNDALRLAQAC